MKKSANALKFGLGIILSIVCMTLAFRKVDFSQMMVAIRGVNYFYLIMVFGCVLLSDWLRALRWQYLLIPVKHIGIGNLFSSLIIGYAANIIFPAHLGELLRAYVVGKKQSLPTSCTLATIVTERIIDMFSLLILMAFTVSIYPFPDWVNKSGYFMFLGTGLLFLFMLLLKKKTEKTIAVVRKILKPLPSGLKNRLLKMVSSFIDGLVGLKNWKHYFIVVFLSFSIWACYLFSLIFGFLAFEFYLPWIAPFVVLIITTISVVVPSSPGYIGTYHWLCQISLGLFGISESPALVFALLVHGIHNVPIFLLGMGFAWREGIQLYRLNKYGLEQEVPDSLNHS